MPIRIGKVYKNDMEVRVRKPILGSKRIWFNGDDARIEARSLKMEAQTSSVQKRDSLPAGRQGYELQQR
jgi:hypothetical protein